VIISLFVITRIQVNIQTQIMIYQVVIMKMEH